MSSDTNNGAVVAASKEDVAKLFSDEKPMKMEGVLCKWTNYINGWQDRYFVLRDGVLSYYCRRGEAAFGCRGSISVSMATIKNEGLGHCCFDVCLNEIVWHLCTRTEAAKVKWLEALEWNKRCAPSRSQSVCHASSASKSIADATSLDVASVLKPTLSLSSPSPSSPYPLAKFDPSPSHPGGAGLKEKLEELNTFKKSLCQQVDTLLSTVETCSDLWPTTADLKNVVENGEQDEEVLSSREQRHQQGLAAVDLKTQATVLKATSAGILTTLTHCVEVMGQREEAYKRKLERERERRRQLEELLQQPGSEGIKARLRKRPGFDFHEGSPPVMSEDEFHDAVESSLDKLDEEYKYLERLRQHSPTTPRPPLEHPLMLQIDSMVREQVKHALMDMKDGDTDPSGWQLITEEDTMKLYRRELEVDGVMRDPCKAITRVRGVTAHEMTYLFWTPEFKFDWDASLEKCAVLDRLDPRTMIVYMVHKRMWPTAQRDSLFWSHLRHIPNDDPMISGQKLQPYDTWVVTTCATPHPHDPNKGLYMRLMATICLLCQTFIKPPLAEGETVESISRDRLVTKMIYCSHVDPGGWAPSSVLRVVVKREYPRFVKSFSCFVADKVRDTPIAVDGLDKRYNNGSIKG